MPCFTRVKTSLIDLETIFSAAEKLGIQVTKRTSNSYTLCKGDEQVSIERSQEGAIFYASDFDAGILQPLTVEYTAQKVKKYYKTLGYTVSAGQKAGDYVFTKYS